ncbi:hypothetical protein AVEN_219480-1 [Araneus ventricosus]|uniref:Uncharacterized protein n=1 Tax=Araneus ventricosus TaxID=182803 RepID=A0A4Y2BQ91_ARAVE|nr:hypothetical protein AVEN_219480-1 [Araneus ventricosus]
MHKNCLLQFLGRIIPAKVPLTSVTRIPFVNMSINDHNVLLHLRQQPVCFHSFQSIDLGESFTDGPKRTTIASIPRTSPPDTLTPIHPPLHPHGGLQHFRESSPPPRPDFFSPTHFLPPKHFPPHTGDLSPFSKNHISFLWPSIPMENQRRWNSNFAVYLRQLSSGFHIDE